MVGPTGRVLKLFGAGAEIEEGVKTGVRFLGQVREKATLVWKWEVRDGRRWEWKTTHSFGPLGLEGGVGRRILTWKCLFRAQKRGQSLNENKGIL